MAAGRIRVGVGGWTFAPWRDNFYPANLPHAKELAYAGEHLTAIEINGTYHGTQKPESFAKWAKAVPDGFVFSVKASRYATNRKVLAEAGESVAKFVGQGIVELGDRLGPILWQFMGTKKFDADDFGAFLDLLPDSHAGVPLRHAIEPRHHSFRCAEFVEMARKKRAAIVFADSATHPQIADLSGDFAYARLQRTLESEATGYAKKDLDRWAEVAKTWAKGESPDAFPLVADAPKPKPRDVFVFVISGAKERNPAAAQALIERVGHPSS